MRDLRCYAAQACYGVSEENRDKGKFSGENDVVLKFNLFIFMFYKSLVIVEVCFLYARFRDKMRFLLSYLFSPMKKTKMFRDKAPLRLRNNHIGQPAQPLSLSLISTVR